MKASILYSLFTALRSDDRLVAGGIGEYLLLEENLEKFELNNFEDFVFACEILLVKKQSEQAAFRNIMNTWRKDIEEYIKEQYDKLKRMKDPASIEEVAPVRPSAEKETRETPITNPLETRATTQQEVQAETEDYVGRRNPADTVEKRTGNEKDSMITITVTDETREQPGSGTAFRPETNVASLPVKNFLLDNEYFPISNRYLRQNWRSLKNRQEENEYGTIDLMATIDEITRTGFFRNFEYQKKIKNLLSLYIFIDRGSSMAAATSFGKELVESAYQSDLHRQIKPWYFYDVPEVAGRKNEDLDYKLLDEKETRSVRISQLFKDHNKRNIVALVYSDAGALSLSDSEKLKRRAEKTKLFLQFLIRNTAYTAWLNPAPRHRWENTIADNIAGAFAEAPMFEANSAGFERAINALRGKVAIK